MDQLKEVGAGILIEKNGIIKEQSNFKTQIPILISVGIWNLKHKHE
jgi:hypothetical protein